LVKRELGISIVSYLGEVFDLVQVVGCKTLEHLGEVLELYKGGSTLFVVDFVLRCASDLQG
jgi:hypothetical protein